MKAVRLHAYHEWPSVDEVPEPQITAPNDVIVRIGGAGLCRTDLHIWEGQWAPKSNVELPYIIGHENAGWVHEVGSAVANVQPGDAVICHPLRTCGHCRQCRDGDEMHCQDQAFPGINTDGGWAELLRTDSRAVIKLPDGVEPADVAAHADAGLTAYHAVKKANLMGTMLPGMYAVVLGVGGLGHIGLQSAKAVSAANIIAVDKKEEVLDLARQWGADYTVLADGSEVDKVLEITDGHGAETVFDFVAEDGMIPRAWGMTRRHGYHHIIGYGENIDVPAIDVISTERTFMGDLVGTYNDLAELMVLQAQGKVTLHTTKFPLDDAVHAMQELHHGRLPGRGIFVP